MKINFERTGGFAGMKLAVNLDLDSLPPADAAALQKLIADADLFSIPDPETQSSVRDGFQYTITALRESQQRVLRVSDGSIPSQLLPLLNELSLRARTNRH